MDQRGEFVSNPLVLASKEIYLKLVHRASRKVKKENNKIVFLLSFSTSSRYTLQLLYENFPDQLVICYTSDSKMTATDYKRKGCSIFDMDDFSTLLKKIVPIVSGSRLIFCDNYFAFLAGVSFSLHTKVVQLWHANGAIKAFGFEAKYTENVTKTDKKRYMSVYDKFTHYVVSSRKMTNIFAKNYQQKINELPFGYIPTDLFFDQNWVDKAKKCFYSYYPDNKKTMLYVPTYREKAKKIPLDFSNLQRQLGNEWQIMVKLHPHDKDHDEIINEPNIITDFYNLDLVQLLPSVDCLITDYSSVPFEYSLANPKGKIIFFCFDYEEYNREVGIEKGFTEWAPGEIVQTEEALISAIKKPTNQGFSQFNQLWNEYVNGDAGQKLLKWVNKIYEN
ncbi:CDP-glycerol glycerophosphotransferase family protein [Tetragenococcus halophilus]|nr:CDP-glycerol glycerophosphotransferase family protein [Tetragenococcus halophilus]NWO00095.1 CDP-glycerol glycerophosphotransferase family protein [Tetragenococcus halophilus]